LKTRIVLSILLFASVVSHSQSNKTILGVWKNVEDETKMIEFYENSDNIILGRALTDLNSRNESKRVIIRDLLYDGSKKTYSGKMSPPGKDLELNATISFDTNDGLIIVGRKFLLKKTIYLERVSKSN